MTMNNTYNRQVQAAPANLNPNQPYEAQYDTMAELGKQMTDFGTEALNLFAKVDFEAAQAETKEKFDKREIEKNDLKRRIELSQDVRSREDTYKKGLDVINKKYGNDVDSRFQKDFSSWVDIADKKDLTDLRFNADKDLQQQAVNKIFNHIEQAAKQTVGANDAYVAMLDAGVQNDLKGMLDRGAISQLEYDKALRNYNESKVYNNLNHRLIVDPEGLALDLKKNTYGLDDKNLKVWQRKANDELKINDLRNRTAENNMIEANTLQVLGMLTEQKDPPQNLLNQLPEKTQAAMQKVRQFAVRGEDVPTDLATYSFLNELRQKSPERFKNLNIYDYAGELSTEDLTAFRSAQNAIIIGLDGKAKVNPDIKHNDDLLKAAHESLELKETAAKYEFDKLFDAEVRGYFAEKGRFPTQLEQEDIVNRLKKSVARRGWFSFKKEVRLLDEDDQPYVAFEEIPENTKSAIYSMLAKHPNFTTLQKLDDEDQEKVVEDLAGVYERPRGQWESATRTIINKWLIKAQEAE